MVAKVPPHPEISLNYAFTLAYEENYDYTASIEMFINNWHVPISLAIIFYLPALYIGQAIMRNREPINLKIPMMFWNASLSLFSIVGFARVFPEMYYTISKFGFNYSICNNSYIHVKECRFWIYLFVLSKIPELGDTFFLVLRKQKLIFLHVYHHATVLIFSWFVYSNAMATARWFCTMNYAVHSVMYTYYLLKALPNFVGIPKWVSMFITSMQTIQMVVGAFVVSASYYAKLTGRECATTTIMSIFGMLIYISYLFLFSQFFYKAYCSSKPPKEYPGSSSEKKSS